MGLFDPKPEPPPPTSSYSEIAHRYAGLEASIEALEKVVGTLWQTEPCTRTGRLADIVSLLDRAKSKARLERQAYERKAKTNNKAQS